MNHLPVKVIEEDGRETKKIRNDWKKAGLLFYPQRVKVRQGEEWHRTISCQRPSHLSFRMDGDAIFQYLDCTFLQAGGGNSPGCLL